MKREILQILRIDCCCPGHDTYHSDTYQSRRSKKARARDKKKEHRHARRVIKGRTRKEYLEEIGNL